MRKMRKTLMDSLDLKEFDGTTVLVTGGAGFVGSNLCRFLLESTAVRRIVVVDNFMSSEPGNIPIDPRVDLVVGSVADPRTIAKISKKLDYVFHLACFHGNQSSIHDPILDHDNNSLTSLMLFDHLKHNEDIRKVVYAAAGCAVAVKTHNEPAATHEDAPVSLFHDSPYSISKLIGEMYGNFYFKSTGMPFVKARFQNVYGPGEVLGAGQWRGTPHTIWRNVTPTFIWRALHHEALNLDNNGKNTRDFIYVSDLVEGLVRCAALGRPGESYNLGTGEETSILELAETVILETGSRSPIVLSSPRTWDSSGRRFASTEKSQDELGFTAQVSLNAGIGSTVIWFKENLNFIRSCVQRYAPLE